MRRKVLIAAALAVLASQGPAAAWAGERGAVAGRVVKEPVGKGVAGATVRLTGADRVEARRVTRTAVTDESGRFRFTGVAAGPRRNYVVATKRAGGYFAARSVVVEPGHTAHRAVRTWPTTDRPEVVKVRSDSLYLVPSREGVSVVESVTFENNSDAAYVGRGDRMLDTKGSEAAPATSLGLALPPAATGGSFSVVRSDLPLARIRPATFGFGLVNALPPGAHSILFSYNVTGSGGTFVLTRPALYPVERLAVFASAPLEVDGSGLEFAGRTVIRGQTFGKWTRTEDFRPLDEVSIAAAARASNTLGLLAGAGLLLALAIAAGFRLRQRRRAGTDSSDELPREQVVGAIAELDISHAAGEIGDEEWRARRRRLKERIASRSDKEPVT